MGKVLFVGPTYFGRSLDADASRCINFYPEQNAPMSKDIASLVGTPGLKPVANLGWFPFGVGSPIRGAHAFNDKIYLVVDNALLVLGKGVPAYTVGTLDTSSGKVSIANNGLSPTGGNQLMIVDGPKGYIYNVSTNTFTTLSGGGWPSAGANTVCFIGGYFIVSVGGGSAQWQVSNLYDGLSWNSLYKSTADAMPDSLMSVSNHNGELALFGEYTTEFWYNTGLGSPPFARVSGGVVPYGTQARWSVAEYANNVFFIAQVNTKGQAEYAGVYMFNGYTPTKISTQNIDYIIQGASTLTDAEAYCYSQAGHVFYILTFPTANVTLSYDLTTDMWHERSTYAGTISATGRHIGSVYVYQWNNHYLGDYNSPVLYQLTSSRYDDAGLPIISIRTAPHLSDKEGLNKVFYTKLLVDGEFGVGAETNNAILATTAVSTYAGTYIDILFTGTLFYLLESNQTRMVNYNTVEKLWSYDTPSSTHAWTGFCYSPKRNEICVVGTGINVNMIGDMTTGNWTDNTMSATANWQSVAWGNNLYVAVASGGSVAASSPDGATWTARTLPSSSNWKKAIWGGDRFIAMSSTTGTAAAFSVDGTAWSASTLPISCAIQDVAWNGSVFCALLTTGGALTSPDGINWTARSFPGGFSGKSITWNGEVFCVVGSASANAITSPDGITWTTHTITSGTYVIASGDKYMMAMSNGAGLTMTYTPAVTGFDRVNPTALLSWSNDGGHTFSGQYPSSMGTTGKALTRMIWRRLGYASSRVFKLMITSPVKKLLMSAYAETEKGTM